MTAYAAADVPAERGEQPPLHHPDPGRREVLRGVRGDRRANSTDTSSPPIGIGTAIAGAAPASIAPVARGTCGLCGTLSRYQRRINKQHLDHLSRRCNVSV